MPWWRSRKPRSQRPDASDDSTSAWEQVRQLHLAVMDLAAEEWRLEAEPAVLLSALFGSHHPLGELLDNLLEVFEARLGVCVDTAAWAVEVHALLECVSAPQTYVCWRCCRKPALCYAHPSCAPQPAADAATRVCQCPPSVRAGRVSSGKR